MPELMAVHSIEDCDAAAEEREWEVLLRHEIQAGRRSRSAYEAALSDPELEFALVNGQVVHDRSCHTVLTAANLADRGLTEADPAEFAAAGAPQWPRLVTRQAVLSRNLRRCRICAPDLPEREKSTKHLRRRSGLGWPEPEGAKSQAKVEPGGCR